MENVTVNIVEAPVVVSISVIQNASPITVNVSNMKGDPGTIDNLVNEEVPTGTINGSNATFTTEFDFEPESVEVYINGIKQRKVTDYNTSGNRTIQLNTSPLTGDILLINYLKIV